MTTARDRTICLYPEPRVSDVPPELCGRRQHLGVLDTSLIFVGETFTLGGARKRSGYSEPEFIDRCRPQYRICATARSLGIKQFVAAHRVNALGRAGDEVIGGLWITFAPKPSRIGTEREALGRSIDRYRTRLFELALA